MEEKEEFILHFKSGKYTVSALAQMFEISRCYPANAMTRGRHAN
jgi:hypothetical protein